MSLLIPEVFILLLTDTIFLLLMLYITPSVIQIIKGWDFNSQSSDQYNLEKRRLLISTIVRFTFILKIPLFLYYIYLNDKLSNVLTGAMCATGSINATVYGASLLYIKVTIIYLMYIWIVYYNSNNSFKDLPYIKTKYKLLSLIIILATVETILTYLNFNNIDPTAIVSCCSSIYSTTSENNSLIMSIKPFKAFYIFIMTSTLLIISMLLKRPLWISIMSVLFFFTGIINLILFTSTYVYQLPSHKCPFCILQSDYGYIGYLFYISLFISTTSGISIYFYNKLQTNIPKYQMLVCLIFSIFFIFLSVFFPLKYYFINLVWL
ncbi:MAG: hypothetical protein C0603_03080 [Denitrovibrio sp.]|nr:MAG: hypothetical protein C0603_03080 [Denitrovibrio sp.]